MSAYCWIKLGLLLTKNCIYFRLYPLVLLNIPGIRISIGVPPDPAQITNGSEQCLSDPLYSYHYWCLAWFLRRTLYLSTFIYSVGKSFPVLAWTGCAGSRKLRFREFLDSRHIKVGSLSAIHTGCLYSKEKPPGTHLH